ncbi:MAG: DUF2301 domain-containing membrane protein [Elainellaceae cyanobacterium]
MMTNSQIQHQDYSAEVYQGQFGEFTITKSDRLGVMIYRGGLMVAAISFAMGVALTVWEPQTPIVLSIITLLYASFSLALGISLLTIHIYLAALHRFLQVCWLIGVSASVALIFQNSVPLPLLVYEQPAVIWGIGFTFVALTGIFFKEAFCFNRFETKLLTPLVPLLLLGHLSGILSPPVSQALLGVWAVLMMVFAVRKALQPIPPDIGDKSVFDYLRQQRLANHSNT